MTLHSHRHVPELCRLNSIKSTPGAVVLTQRNSSKHAPRPAIGTQNSPREAEIAGTSIVQSMPFVMPPSRNVQLPLRSNSSTGPRGTSRPVLTTVCPIKLLSSFIDSQPAETVGIGVGVPKARVAGTNSLKLQSPRSGLLLFS